MVLASQVELADILRILGGDELLKKVFEVAGRLNYANSYEVAKILGRPLERDAMEKLNSKIQALQTLNIAVISPDTIDPTSLYISVTPKGWEVHKALLS
jgi:hypothetical protein